MNIWTAWLQGRSKAPDFVQANFRRWEELNPAHQVHVVEQAKADEILKKLGVAQPRITPQVTTNLVRSYLLCEHGGAWVDATLLPTIPISDWLGPELTSQGFFAFRSLGDPHLVLQNWFLFAEQGNKLMAAWLDFYCNYFQTVRYYPTWKRALWHGRIGDYLAYRKAEKRRDPLWFVDPARGRDCVFYPYALHNYSLSYLLGTRPEIANIWAHVPHRSAALPQIIGDLARNPETTRNCLMAAMPELLKAAPVHKLNHRNKIFEEVLTISKGLSRQSPC